MIIFKGLNLFLQDFFKASHKERVEFFKEIYRYMENKFKDYWIGYISINKNHIYDTTDGENKLYTVSIIVGKRREGQWFSNVDAGYIERIIEHVESNNSKYFNLHMNLGGAYQDYLFNKKQQKLLVKRLKDALKDEVVYKERLV